MNEMKEEKGGDDWLQLNSDERLKIERAKKAMLQ